MRELGEKVERGTGDRRPPELLPGYDPDWRRNAQIYPAALKLDDLWDLKKYFSDHSRTVGHHDIAAAFGLMMGLADDHLVTNDVSFCDPSEKPVGRAYQAAVKVIDAFYLDKRLRVEPTYLAAARIVVLRVHAELFLHDLVQKKRELSAWALSKARHPSPGAFNTVPDVLALWRGLRIGGEAFEGSRLDAVADRFDLDRSTVSESVNNVAIPHLQETFGLYCKGLPIPHKTGGRPCYSKVFEDGRNERTDHLQPALAPPVKLDDNVRQRADAHPASATGRGLAADCQCAT
jgi:hypothetical protein